MQEQQQQPLSTESVPVRVGAKKKRHVLKTTRATTVTGEAQALPPVRVVGVTNAETTRLARRGGVKSRTADVTDETNVVLRQYVQRLLGQIIPIVEGGNRRTVTKEDVQYALNRMGTPLYG